MYKLPYELKNKLIKFNFCCPLSARSVSRFDITSWLTARYKPVVHRYQYIGPIKGVCYEHMRVFCVVKLK